MADRLSFRRLFAGKLFVFILFAVVSRMTAQVTPPFSEALTQWKSQMITKGRASCADLQNPNFGSEPALAATYYDAQRVFLQIHEYTKDAYWLQCAEAAEAIYRDKYVLPNQGRVPGYWNFTHGLMLDYLKEGDPDSKRAVQLLATNAAYAPDTTPLTQIADPSLSREVAYTILSYLNAERIGLGRRDRLGAYVQAALGHYERWFVRKDTVLMSFMTALTAEALIQYYETVSPDPTILASIRTGMDELWNRMWMPNTPAPLFTSCSNTVNRNVSAFLYVDGQVYDSNGQPTDNQCVGAAPDLNLLIAPVFGWLYKRTHEVRFRDRGDQIFAGGVQGAFLEKGKQFNQNYRWSFDYCKWRGCDDIPPSITLIRPLNNGTVKAGAMTRIGGPVADNVGVTRVDFFVNGALTCSDNAAVFLCDWRVPAAIGQLYQITAKAYDAAGNAGSSAPVRVKSVP